MAKTLAMSYKTSLLSLSPSQLILLPYYNKTQLVKLSSELDKSKLRRVVETMLQAAVAAALDPRAPMELATLQNEIANGDLELNELVSIQLTDSEKTQNMNAWRTY